MKERFIYMLTQGNTFASLGLYGFALFFIIAGVYTDEPIATALGIVMILFFWVINYFGFKTYKKEGW